VQVVHLSRALLLTHKPDPEKKDLHAVAQLTQERHAAARWVEDDAEPKSYRRGTPGPRGLNPEASIRYLAFGAAAGLAMISRYACASDGMHNCSSNSCFGFQCHSAVVSTYGLV
jgi:hypothetical protein